MPSEALTLRGSAVDSPARPARARRRVERVEHRLAARLRDGDPAALEEAYRAYGAATFGLLLRMLRDRGTAEDVQQQVFTEVWQRGAEYDPARGGILTWVLTIARSRAIDYLRKRRPEPHDPQAASVLADAAAPGPAEDDAVLDRWRVVHLLGRLPEDERRVLQLRFYEGLSQTEIARATGTPLGTVKTKMVRALLRLRDLIEREGA